MCLAAASRDLLGFTFNGSVYRFKALPFGLKPAPRLFTRLVGCVAVFRRQRGLRNFFLLPRRLTNGSQLPPSATAAPALLLQTVQALGFHYQLGQVGAHPDSVPESGDL